MSINLMKLRTKHTGKCARCHREIGEQWDVYYSKDTKAVYCLQCGEVLLNEPETSEIPDDIEIQALIGNLSLKMDNVIAHQEKNNKAIQLLIETLSNIFAGAEIQYADGKVKKVDGETEIDKEKKQTKKKK